MVGVLEFGDDTLGSKWCREKKDRKKKALWQRWWKLVRGKTTTEAWWAEAQPQAQKGGGSNAMGTLGDGAVYFIFVTLGGVTA